MGAFRIFSRFAELLDVKVTRAAAAWLRLNADGTVSERTAAETLGDLGAASTYAPISTTVTLSGNQTIGGTKTFSDIGGGGVIIGGNAFMKVSAEGYFWSAGGLMVFDTGSTFTYAGTSAESHRTALGLGALATSTDAANLTGNIAVARIATALTTPGPIGGTTPAAISATTVTASGAIYGGERVNATTGFGKGVATPLSQGMGFSGTTTSIIGGASGAIVRLTDNSGNTYLSAVTAGTTITGNLAASGTVTGASFTEGITALGTVVSTATITISSGSSVTATLTASTACTFTMPTAASGLSFILHLKQAAATGNGSAAFTGVVWAGGIAPTITATAGKMDIISFVSGPNAAGSGYVWYGSALQNLTPP